MRGRCGGCGAVVIMAGVVACDPPDAPIDGGRTEFDAGEVTPTVCVDRGDDTPFVAEVDPATGCPTSICFDHAYSGPGFCDTIRACCTFAPACVFSARYRLFIRGQCGGRELLPPVEESASGCSCVDGRLSCESYRGAVGNACLDCFLGSARLGPIASGAESPIGGALEWVSAASCVAAEGCAPVRVPGWNFYQP